MFVPEPAPTDAAPARRRIPKYLRIESNVVLIEVLPTGERPGTVDVETDASANLEAELYELWQQRRDLAAAEDFGKSLLETYTESEQQSLIYYQLALVYAQSGQISPSKTIEYARNAWWNLNDPVRKAQLFVFWGDALQLSKDRREAAKAYLRGLEFCLQFGLPEDKPDRPGVSRYRVDGPAEVIEEYRRKNRVQAAAWKHARFLEDLIQHRQALTGQIVQLYVQQPDAFDELHELVMKYLYSEQAAEQLIAAAKAYRTNQKTSIPVITRMGPDPDPEADLHWGQPTEGISVRLRATGATWAVGQTPKFKIDVRNDGSHILKLTPEPQCWQVEVDGVRYDVVVPMLGGLAKSMSFGPDKRWYDLELSLDTVSGLVGENGRVELLQGRHIVRVVLAGARSADGIMVPIGAMSELVEIDVLPLRSGNDFVPGGVADDETNRSSVSPPREVSVTEDIDGMVRDVLYGTYDIGTAAWSPMRAADRLERLLEVMQKEPKIQALFAVAARGTDAQKKALLQSVKRMCNVYLNGLPEFQSDTDAPWQPTVINSPGVMAYPPLLLQLEDDPGETLDMVTQMYLRMQDAYANYFRAKGTHEHIGWGTSDEGAVMAFVCHSCMSRLGSDTAFQERATAKQLRALREYEGHCTKSARWNPADDELNVMKFAERIHSHSTSLDSGWGEQVRGLAVRLRADRTVWKTGEAPALKMEVRNDGQNAPYIPYNDVLTLLEVNGQWYRRHLSSKRGGKFKLEPGERHEIELPFVNSLWFDKDSGQNLEAKPGKYILRAGFTDDPGDTRLPVTHVSNPVQIEILPPEEGGDFNLVGTLKEGTTRLRAATGLKGSKPRKVSTAERPAFMGLDLTDAPSTREPWKLPDWQDARSVFDSYTGAVYYNPAKNVFYVEHSNLVGVSHPPYYGPFEGDPYDVLDLKVFYKDLSGYSDVLKSRPTIAPVAAFTRLFYEVETNGLSAEDKKALIDKTLNVLKNRLASAGKPDEVWIDVKDEKIELWIPNSQECLERLDVSDEWKEHSESGERLDRLGRVLRAYANDNQSSYPHTLEQLHEQGYIGQKELQWALEHVTYRAKGTTMAQAPDMILAYDRLFLAAHGKTYVIFNDRRVDLLKEDQLKELGISAETKPEAAADWGWSVEGVQCRLRPDKLKWEAGETPMLKADIRNLGKPELSVVQHEGLCELWKDGRWYHWEGEISARSSVFGPGRQYDDIPITLDEHWVAATNGKPLRLSRRHLVRVAFITQSPQGEIIRVHSNPVRIEVLPPEAGSSTSPRRAASEAEARRAIVMGRSRRISYIGLDLTDARHTTGRSDLTELFRESPAGSGNYVLRDDVIAARHPEFWEEGVIYYIPAREQFYIVVEPGHPKSSQTFYGPFAGRPWNRFGMTEPQPPKKQHRFAIYLVVDPIDAANPEGVDIEQLRLASEPVPTEQDIVEYEWDEHYVKLTPDARKRVPSPRSVWGLPFVVVADGHRCYLGAFWSFGSSYMPKVPRITSTFSARPHDCIQIAPGPITGDKDPRNDRRIRRVFQELGI
jgi:hypothetical protein